jgi:hypothetical protein
MRIKPHPFRKTNPRNYGPIKATVSTWDKPLFISKHNITDTRHYWYFQIELEACGHLIINGPSTAYRHRKSALRAARVVIDKINSSMITVVST